jgi:hypothetical protein
MNELKALGTLITLSVLGAVMGHVWGWWALLPALLLWLPAGLAWYELLWDE